MYITTQSYRKSTAKANKKAREIPKPFIRSLLFFNLGEARKRVKQGNHTRQESRAAHKSPINIAKQRGAADRSKRAVRNAPQSAHPRSLKPFFCKNHNISSSL
jgi:hypothetical protein